MSAASDERPAGTPFSTPEVHAAAVARPPRDVTPGKEEPPSSDPGGEPWAPDPALVRYYRQAHRKNSTSRIALPPYCFADEHVVFNVPGELGLVSACAQIFDDDAASKVVLYLMHYPDVVASVETTFLAGLREKNAPADVVLRGVALARHLLHEGLDELHVRLEALRRLERFSRLASCAPTPHPRPRVSALLALSCPSSLTVERRRARACRDFVRGRDHCTRFDAHYLWLDLLLCLARRAEEWKILPARMTRPCSCTSCETCYSPCKPWPQMLPCRHR